MPFQVSSIDPLNFPPMGTIGISVRHKSVAGHRVSRGSRLLIVASYRIDQPAFFACFEVALRNAVPDSYRVA